MALTQALQEARRQTATRENRERQTRAELRLEEIIKVSGIADQYDRIDRIGDVRIETNFARLYQAATDPEVRRLVVQTYLSWQDDERNEEQAVHGEVSGSVSFLKANNPAFIDGAFVPAGSDGVA